MTKVLAIDPGLHGACALREERGVVVASMPRKPGLRGREVVDAAALYAQLEPFADEIVLAVIEDVYGQPRDGALRAFSFGRSTGKQEAVLEVLSALSAKVFPVVHVNPQHWQKELLPCAGDTKEESIAAAKRLWPTLDLKVSARHKNDSPDRSDAALLAEYGWRHREELLGRGRTP